MPEWTDPVDAEGRPIDQQPMYDKMIRMELHLHQGYEMRSAKVIGRSLGPDGRSVGVYDDNPILNTLVYDIEFDNGEVKEDAANIIAENMLSQVDSDGYQVSSFDCIAKDSDAVTEEDQYVRTHAGKRLRQTTCGWKLSLQTKEMDLQWVPLKDMKESHPVEVAEYARTKGIANEPA